MKYRAEQIEKAAGAINQMRAAEYQKSINLEIDKIMKDRDLLWEALRTESKRNFRELMHADVDSNDPYANGRAVDILSDMLDSVRCDVAYTASLDVSIVAPASREEAIDFLEMEEVK